MTGIAYYRRICQKNEEENYLLDKYLFRRISIYVTVLFIKLGFRADTVTFLSLAASLSSLYFLTGNSPAMMITAAVLIICYYILDHVDGELARYYVNNGLQKSSFKGRYLDLLVHRFSSNLMIFFMGLSVYRLYGYEPAVILGFLAFTGLSSFPNVVASRILCGRAARSGGKKLPVSVQDALWRLERKREQIALVKGNTAARVKKILMELLVFPGHIIVMVAVIIADAILGEGLNIFSYHLNIRFIFIAVMAFLFITKSIIQGYYWVKKLGRIL